MVASLAFSRQREQSLTMGYIEPKMPITLAYAKKMLTRDLSLPLASQEISDSLAECKMAHLNCLDSTVRLSALAGRKLTAQAKGKK